MMGEVEGKADSDLEEDKWHYVIDDGCATSKSGSSERLTMDRERCRELANYSKALG